MWARGLGVVGAVAFLAVSAVPALAGSTLDPQPSPASLRAQLVHAIGGHNADPADARFAYLSKLDGHLQDVAANRVSTAGVTLTPAGAAVDVYVDGDLATATAHLRALGMDVVAASDSASGRVVEGSLPAGALAQAAALGETHAILPVIPPIVQTGSVLSQGDAALHGPAARASGSQGLGTGVGIISDSFSAVGGGAADSESTGDLDPAEVTVLRDDPAGTDEGRAMAEIVHDEAPLASIAFSSGDFGPASKAAAIDSFAGHANLIADDIVYPGEPYFQDDVIAQAVDRAKARGTAYFAAAGNQRGGAWEGTYSPVADPSGRSATTEDFDPGPGVDTVQTVGTIPTNGAADIVVQWAEPWGGASTDLAIDVYQIVGGVPTWVFTTNTDNRTTGIPEEWVSFTNSGSAAQFGFAIRRVAGTGTPLIKYIGYGDTTSYTIERGSNSGAIGPDAASARGALTVAATRWSTPSTPEYFSSPGPVVHYFDSRGVALGAPEVRQKPDMAGPDGVSTTISEFAPFYGTSAAAPAAAGVGALIMGARPDLSMDELYAIMASPANALACVSASPLNDCGGGFLLADRAVAQARDLTPPVISATVSPPAPDGANGWYSGPVQVAWTVGDTGSPVTDTVGCGPLTPGDTATTFSCSASSAGGPASATVTIRRDSTPPSAPTIVGVTGGAAYAAAKLPASSAIACASADTTSGLAGCAITGYSDVPGTHVLTAVATNGAGLSSTSTLSYVISAAPLPAAISGLTSKRGLTLKTLARSGMTVTIAVASASTRVVASLQATLPKTKGHKAQTIALATLRKQVGAGTRQLHLVLRSAAKKRLGALAKARVTLTVSASAAGATTAKLVHTSSLKR